MKALSRFFFLVLLVFSCIGRLQAQPPNGFSYQAVIRNGSGTIMSNTNVTMRFTIHSGTPAGAVLYKETRALTTTSEGLVNTIIGTGTVVSGSFTSINWSAVTAYLQVEVNLTGTYVDLGTQQLMSVPFAMHANTASALTELYFDDLDDVNVGNASGGQYLQYDGVNAEWIGVTPNTWSMGGNTGTNQNLNYLGTVDQKDLCFRTFNTERLRIKSDGWVGLGTSNPEQKLHIHSADGSTYAKFTNLTTGSGENDGLLVGNLGNTAYIWNAENDDIVFGTFGLEKARFKADGKFVVGTSVADELVHFEGVGWQLHMENSTSGTFWNMGASGTTWGIGAGKFAINNGTASTSAKFVIDSNGFVGIGDTTPDTKLDVVGSISSSDMANGGLRHVYVDNGGVLHTAPGDDAKYYLTIPGHAFHPSQPVGGELDATMDYLISEDGFEFWDNDGQAVAPIILPDGAKITGTTFYMEDNFNDNNVYAEATGRALSGNGVSPYLAMANTSGSPGIVGINGLNNGATVNNAQFYYYVHAWVNQGSPAPGYDNLKLRAVVIEYELHP